MLAQELFAALKEKVLQLAAHLPPASEEARINLEHEARAIKAYSDLILDEWVEFEELFDQKIRPHFSKLFPESVLEEWKQAFSEKGISSEEGTSAGLDLFTGSHGEGISSEEGASPGKGPSLMLPDLPDWIKGKGYYDLEMYEESYPLLRNAVEEVPDHEIVRLYFASACYYLNKREEAQSQFTLLEKTASSPRVRAISCNGLGLLASEARDYDMAIRAFQTALDYDPELWVARYNLGLIHYLLQSYLEAIRHWESFLTHTHQWDVELSLLLGSCYLFLGYYNKATQIWNDPVPPSNPAPFLRQLAHFFENRKQYPEAMACYEEILRMEPNDSYAYHGYAWNLWLSQPNGTRAIPLLKKSLSLQPNNLNALFSLAWILYHQKEWADSERITAWMLRADPDFSLALSLQLLLSLRKGDRMRAQQIAERLQDHGDERGKSLGNLFRGRLKLSEQKLEDAIADFQRSVWNNPYLKESYLLQGLAHYLNGEPDKALKIWNRRIETVPPHTMN